MISLPPKESKQQNASSRANKPSYKTLTALEKAVGSGKANKQEGLKSSVSMHGTGRTVAGRAGRSTATVRELQLYNSMMNVAKLISAVKGRRVFVLRGGRLSSNCKSGGFPVAE